MMFDRFDPFEKKSFASLLGIVFLICLIRWGRVFCFLHGDGVFDVLKSLRMVLDVLDRGKWLLLPLPFTGESFDNFVPNWIILRCPSFFFSFLFYFILFIYFFFFTVFD